MVRTAKGQSQRYPVGQTLQCGLANEVVNVPSCQELPTIIEQCIQIYADKD